jgi:3-methyl-2-oxobutanoate hydroxymethyltransferase
MLTVYTARMAGLLDPHCDALLVGDGLANVIYRYPTMAPRQRRDDGCARRRHRTRIKTRLAFRSVSWRLQETGAGAVKREGGAELASTVAFLESRGVPVMGHVV